MEAQGARPPSGASGQRARLPAVVASSSEQGSQHLCGDFSTLSSSLWNLLSRDTSAASRRAFRQEPGDCGFRASDAFLNASEDGQAGPQGSAGVQRRVLRGERGSEPPLGAGQLVFQRTELRLHLVAVDALGSMLSRLWHWSRSPKQVISGRGSSATLTLSAEGAASIPETVLQVFRLA